ncbi:MAG: N-acetylmuramoyl-L-alanine amidase [Chryseobacterium sp.]|jgi:N-acetylmuramoyl-L-alanine amidase|uniref:N-acetylmuramoyl-L-alanine amidase family protein n=1 Tax=Chryseobacterium sp. TaxID=1871047 RepID=UPI00261AE36F|nr:N-acetylmuramoyl-L-alanine amidase [Chryseobacterium sp.]MDF2554010.1 N-acetylmuramoyl-L-alanine amidase [Chryseobacterium sp.]
MNVKKLLIVPLFAVAFLSFKPIDKKIIVIDAGHGGNDMGAIYDGVSEKQIVLDIASKIKQHNQDLDDYEIVLTRDSDAYATLADRTAMINKLNPEMVISLHINRSPAKESAIKGHEIFTQNTEASKSLAEKISKKFGECKIEEKNLHILRESKSPAVLVELGFINNTEDRKYLISETGQKEVAKKFIEIITEK